ncbi:unnamed protein product [Bursaphelenchus xylophilus]|uniref:(pine wood nematode) hypothetical protein n=1 Tax=Bursaphelenchus xylophilus TaxID=6326 RepID=A0A1I7RRG7_BURXY|nr:unnamed protein product [Bursaphelenchus xylophilus]CAG9131026.1 unnamed protein product [Bursaphelenchus xylophilus]
MRSQQSSVTAQRKKQEESNAQEIRQLLHQEENKYCFECGQRGPTYVNVTNGSFCCMHCSGILRGLHPPHRVKSISMATFTNEDVEKLKKTGNKVNAFIYLGLYDGKTKFEPRVDEEVRKHLVEKYETRRWYVSPNDVEMQKRLLEECTEQSHRRNSLSGQSVKSHKSNQSAPPNLHTSKPNGPIDILTGDLLDLTFSSTPAPPQPVQPKTLPEDDWTSLFMDPVAKAPLQSTTSFPFVGTSVPPPLQFPMPSIPPPKPRDHQTSGTSHSTSFAEFDNKPVSSDTQGFTLPSGWESFSAGVPKSATTGFLKPENQQTTQPPFDPFPSIAPPKKTPPPLPQSRPVANLNGSSDPFKTPVPPNPVQPGDEKDNWNPFLG